MGRARARFYEAETFGLVLLEAMSFGLPVVATDFCAIGSIVVPDVTGLLVPPQDVSALAAALRALLEDPERREALCRAGRRRYEAQYTLEHWLSAMERALLIGAA